MMYPFQGRKGKHGKSRKGFDGTPVLSAIPQGRGKGKKTGSAAKANVAEEEVEEEEIDSSGDAYPPDKPSPNADFR